MECLPSRPHWAEATIVVAGFVAALAADEEDFTGAIVIAFFSARIADVWYG